MKVNKVMTKNLAKSADMLNTLNGGTIFPMFDTYKEDDHYRLEVSIPSVDPDNIKVEVNGESLLVYQKIDVNGMKIPSLIGLEKISAEVAVNSITAGYEDDLLIVIMPFNELSGGFRKEIDILRY
jgi:HSP20 family molecular chaperone IbpA